MIDINEEFKRRILSHGFFDEKEKEKLYKAIVEKCGFINLATIYKDFMMDQWLNVLLNNNVTPVFCAITHDENGQLLNTNADTIASELAIAFANDYTTELFYCFESAFEVSSMIFIYT